MRVIYVVVGLLLIPYYFFLTYKTANSVGNTLQPPAPDLPKEGPKVPTVFGEIHPLPRRSPRLRQDTGHGLLQHPGSTRIQ